MAHHQGKSGFIAVGSSLSRRLAVLLATLVVLATPVAAEVVVQTATGIRAVIHTPADVAALLDTSAGRTWLRHPRAGDVELDTTRFGWNTLTTVPADEVAAALDAMQGFTTDVDVDVFLLPGFPRDVWSSFARGQAIFMAPTFAPTPASTIHYLVTHEMGHVLTAVSFDPVPARWDAYVELRGLDATALDPAAPHAERAREILAEDLRHVFGGPLATLSGTIENARLPLPETVPGLTALLSAYLAAPAPAATTVLVSRAYPNPCNPQTTVELNLPAGVAASGREASLEIHDVRGRLVQRVRGADVHGGVVRAIWTGVDASGQPAPSGVYVYVLRLGEVVASGRVSVVR